MELRQLEYFAAVARHGHFGRAAEDLYVTQPALSQQVRRLEAELGIALFRRTSRGVELTPAGDDLLPRAEAMLAEAERARAAMGDHAGVRRGFVRVAATAGEVLGLAGALADFHRANPGIRIALTQASAADAIAMLQRGSADLAVAALARAAAQGASGIEIAPLNEEPLRVALPPADAAAAGAVELWELRDRPFVLAEPGSALRELVTETCERAGFGPVPLFEAGDPVAVRYLVHAGLGVSLVPASWLEQPGPEVAVAQLAGEAPRLATALVSQTAGLSPAAALLRDQLQATLGQRG